MRRKLHPIRAGWEPGVPSGTSGSGNTTFHTNPTVDETSSRILIRPATPADLPAIGRLGALLVRTHHDFDPRRFMPASPRTEQGYAAYVGTQLEQPSTIILVAERAGEVVGYAFAALEGHDYMSLRGPAGVLHDLVVAGEERGRGVGRALLEAAVAVLEQRGAPRVVLSTAERNEAAQRLFAHAGFRRTMIEMTREAGEPAP